MRLQARILLFLSLFVLLALSVGGLAWSKVAAPITVDILIALMLMIGIFSAFWLSRHITTPLNELTRTVADMERGEYQPVRLAKMSKRQDEVGTLSARLNEMAYDLADRDRRLKLLLRIIPTGVALSLENDFQCLLETIVVESQAITNADGGTLYILDGNSLRFVILRNTSLNIAMGGTTGNLISFPPVPLNEKDGTPNHHHVAAHTAHGHEWVNIPDAYQNDLFDFSGTRSFDVRTGYQSHSFLTIPLEGDEHKIIGVLQLINALDPDTGAIIPFQTDEVLKTLVLLASTGLAGYIRQEKLRQEIEKLCIEIDQVKKAHQVSEITETDYFRALKQKAHEMRIGKKNSTEE